MSSALKSAIGKLDALAAISAPAKPRVSQLSLLAAYGPPAAKQLRVSQDQLLIARSAGAFNVDARVSQAQLLIAYGTGVPMDQVAITWTFVLDGHTIWVVSLGPEGDFGYDKDTKQWCQLITQGFDNWNFSRGTMWRTRIMGGDLLYPVLYELDPNAADDEGWRPVMRIVTGGVTVRSTNMIGVANFRVTASLGALADATSDINFSFSDDNGATWTTMEPITIVQGETDVPLVWDGCGSFQAPGRIFQVSDQGGPASINGADVALNNYNEDDGGGAAGEGGGKG